MKGIFKLGNACISLPMVITIISFVSSVSFMSGKSFVQISHNKDTNKEIKNTLDKINAENKKLWEYILTNSKDNRTLRSKIIKEVLDK